MGGMGSINEALLNRVPLMVVPVMGDQPANADCVSSAKIGFGFRYPYRTFNKDALLSAAKALTDTSSENVYKVAIEEIASDIESGGGPDGAAELILGLA